MFLSYVPFGHGTHEGPLEQMEMDPIFNDAIKGTPMMEGHGVVG